VLPKIARKDEQAKSQWLCAADMDAEDELHHQQPVATLTTDGHPKA